MMPVYSSTKGLRLLQELATQGLFIFTVADAKTQAAKIGISDNYLSQILSHLEKAGWIIRLRRGLYAGTGSLPGYPGASLRHRHSAGGAVSDQPLVSYESPRLYRSDTPRRDGIHSPKGRDPDYERFQGENSEKTRLGSGGYPVPRTSR